MPFIRGRYHLNPIAGAALETAREAEEALRAQHDSGHRDDEPDPRSASSPQDDLTAAPGPIHRVEIEAAEVVPAHSGRAQRGFVARIHRTTAADSSHFGGADDFTSPGPVISFFGHTNSANSDSDDATSRLHGSPSKPETRVFSRHHELVDFLRWEFEKDCGK